MQANNQSEWNKGTWIMFVSDATLQSGKWSSHLIL